jgi:hypothetical protein
MMSKEKLIERMECFVSGQDRSNAIASEIEVGLEQVFGEQQPFADLSLALASYQPGGGEYLYDEQQIVALIKHVLEGIRRS